MTILVITFAHRKLQTLIAMDIVSRLKFFMENQRIASSQFADTCRIPRPTLSQLLNGRNKKISDELIGKIHESYPSLSILWLMFGEGDMVIDGNMRISEAKQSGFTEEGLSESSENEEFANNYFDEFVSSMNSSENNDSTTFPLSRINQAVKAHENAESASSDPASEPKRRRISSIVVFYSDNSFQSFSPSGD